jgi:hypothetical protein
MKGIPEPKNAKEFAKARNMVGDKVSEKLGNTRAVALASYVPPEVFSGWKSKLGIKSMADDAAYGELLEWANSVHYADRDGTWDDDPARDKNWWDVPETQEDPDDEEVEG